jgi:hypothetical protein
MSTSGGRISKRRVARESGSRRTARFWLFVILIALVAMLIVPAIASATVAPRGTATSATTTNTNLTIAKPTGVTAGDLMLVTIAKSNNRTTAPSATGWALISGANLGGGTYRYGAVLYKVATADDAGVANYTFALGTGTDNAAGGIVAFSGVDASTPFDVTPGAILVNASSNTVTATGITTASANAAVVMLGMASASAPTWSGWTMTSPGALTELLDRQSTSNSVGAAWRLKATAGATGNGTATLSGFGERNGGLLLALKPARIPLTVHAAGVNRTYDGTTDATVTLSSTDVQAGDTVTYAYTGAAFESATAGLGKTVNVSGISIGGASAGKYALQNTTATTTAAIAPAALTVTAQNQSKTYGDALDLGGTAFTTSGLATGDSVDTVALDSAGAVSTAPVTVVPYAITASAATGAGLDNYDISYVDGELAVDPKNLTIADAVADNKVYDGDNVATVDYSAASLDGVVIPDEVALDASGSSATFADKNVETGKQVTVFDDALIGGAAGNYTLSQPTGLTADITALGITGSFTTEDKTYDGTTVAAVLSRDLDGAVAGDDVALTGGAAAFDTKDVGTQTVTLSGADIALSGADAGNYTLDSVDTATAAIIAKELTVAATGDNKIYDGTTDAAAALDSADIVTGDDVTAHYTSATFADKNVNPGIAIAVDGISISGVDAGNYALQNTDADTSADITALGITGSFTTEDKTYDGTTVAAVLSRDLDGAVAGDDVALTGGAAAFDTKDVGTQTVTLSGADIALSGADAGNYTLDSVDTATAAIIAKELTVADGSAANKPYDGTTDADVDFTGASLVGVVDIVGTEDVTLDASGATGAFVSADAGIGIDVTVDGLALGGADLGNYTLTQPTLSADITPAELTVSATGHNKVYNGTTAASVTLHSSDILGSDVVTMHHTGAAFAGKNVGPGIAIAVSGISISGADAGNYALQNQTATAAADITPAPLTVTATGQDKVYDGTTAAVVTLHSGDVLTGDVVTAQYTGAAFAAKNAGQKVAIAVDGITVGGADAGNYALQNSTASATGNITAKALTITAADQAKQYGQAFTFTGGEFTASGLVSGDSVSSVTLASAGADAAAVAGLYPIVASNAVGSGLGNYTIAYTDGTMTVSGGSVVPTTYTFSVFAKPLRSKDAKKFHLGDKVLVKFTIKDNTGAKVTTLKPRVKITAKGFAFGPKTVKYNAKKKAYVYTLKIGKSWKLRGYNLTTTIAGSTAKGKVKFKVVK